MHPQNGFTLGICATGESPRLSALVESMLAEADSSVTNLRKLIVVASACTLDTTDQLKSIAERDSRVRVLEEGTRRGKAEAMNRVLALTDTPLVAFVNSDSRPMPDALTRVVRQLASDMRAGAVSAMPVPWPGRGLGSNLIDFMWSAHNSCSYTLNHMNIANHSCDELVAYRADAVETLPPGLVNDGAYMAARARQKGFGVQVCPSAKVRIKTPRHIADVIRQRRRILFGHRQVWKKVGAPPKTIESMLFLSPGVGMRILVKSVASSPKFLMTLPVAMVSEALAATLAFYDTVTSSTRHAVWRRLS